MSERERERDRGKSFGQTYNGESRRVNVAESAPLSLLAQCWVTNEDAESMCVDADSGEIDAR